MKKIILFAGCLLALICQAGAQTSPILLKHSDVDNRVLSKFNKVHHPASVVSWWKDDIGLHGYFVEDKIQWRVSFDNNGKLLQSIKYYHSDQLDQDISALVSETFKGHNITGVTELQIGSRKVHFLMIAGDGRAKQIAVYNMEISVQQEFLLN